MRRLVRSDLNYYRDSFDALSLKKLDDGNFKAEIEYLNSDGELVTNSYTGMLRVAGGPVRTLPPVSLAVSMSAWTWTWSVARRALVPADDPLRKRGGGIHMHVDIVIVPSLLALLAGIAILVWPRVLNYIVALYLILIGLLGLLGTHGGFGRF